MSAWSKASKSNQKIHRERHQPESRQHLGLLEKKKDYKKRANNVQQKERVLKALHQRALNKNPDEFYHHMINSRLDDGVHRELKRKGEHTEEQLALMETQNLKYVQMKRTIETKKIQRLQSQLHMIDYANTVQNTHTFFVDEDMKELKSVDLAARLGTHPSLLGRKTNRPKLEDLEKLKLPSLTPEEAKRASELQKESYSELSKRIDREKMLTVVQQKLEMQKALKQKRLQKPEQIKPATKDAAPVYRFKYERKK